VTTRSKAEIALLSTTVIWAGTFTVLKLGMEEISPILLIAVRFLVAWLIVLALFRRRIFPIEGRSARRGALLGVFLFLGFAAQNLGLTITTASKSAFITGMMVVFVPILQVLIERRPPKIGNVLGVVLVSIGLWFLTSPTGSSFNTGDALTLICAIFFALYIVYLDIASKDVRTERLVFLQMGTTAALSWLAVALFETPLFVLTSRSLGALAYLTILATVFTLYVQTRYQKETTPTRAVLIFSVEPVIAAAIAAVVLGEQLGPLGMIGGGIIFTGVLLSELSDQIPVLNRSVGMSRS
jgi:drug/metabolite transporter (DMT)-like permease